MILVLCLALLVIALILQALGSFRRALWFMAAGIGLILVIGFGLVPALLLPMTQLPNTLSDVRWSDRNAIVLLGAGTVARSSTSAPSVPIFAYGRITAAAEAWRDCRAHGKDCTLVISGGDPMRHGAAEAAVYAQPLVALGVPQSSIILEDKSLNTWQNAANSTKLIPADRQIVVVTSGIHLKRSLLFFDHFRAGAQGIAADRLAPEFTLFAGSYNFFLTDAVLHEQIGTLQFHVYNALGLNKAKR